MLTFVARYGVSLCCCLFAHSVGIFFRRQREFIKSTNRYFGVVRFDKNPEPPLKIPQIGIDDLCPGDAPLRMLAPESECGGISPFELVCVNKIAALYAPQRVFEIGTFNGKTTLNLAANAPAAAAVYTLDLPVKSDITTALRPHPWDKDFVAKRESGRHYRESAYAHKIRQLWGDSASFDYGPFAGSIDLVFVDGSHSYEYVKSDSRAALRLLRNGSGTILWHDYGTAWHDVTKALNELFEGDPAFSGLRHLRGTSLVWLRVP